MYSLKPETVDLFKQLYRTYGKLIDEMEKNGNEFEKAQAKMVKKAVFETS
jgi:hypothetical protein